MKYTLRQPVNENYSTIEQIFTNRGIPAKDIENYINVTEKNNLSPLKLKNIEDAAKLLIKHIGLGSRIYVQIDEDCDGYTSGALLLNFLYRLFPSAIDNITYAFHKGKSHGINEATIPKDTALVIAPDASSDELEIHKRLRERGIEVLVLDHHQADSASQNNYACIVNNQLCDYPNKQLSGVGIVYKFCQYIDNMLPTSNIIDDFLDLVAIGLVGDMMDQRQLETHYLTREGLKQLRNPFIRGMADKNAYSIGDTLSPFVAAFYIVPLINAVTRIGTLDEKQLLFDSMLEWKAYELVPSTKRGEKGKQETLVVQSVRTCSNIKNRQTKFQDQAVEQVEQIIKEKGLLNHKILLIRITEPDFHTGITGLIANKLMAKYERPVGLLLATEYEGKPAWAGSARGYSKSEMQDFRTFCRDTGLTFLTAGHDNAFGLGILDENVEEFIRYTDNVLKDISFEPSYKVDYIYSAASLKPQYILDIGSLKQYWGQNIEEALIALEHVAVTKDMLTLMSPDKNPTLKIQLPNGIACIKFHSSEEELDSLYSETGCVTINLVGAAELNRFRGNTTPQIIIKEYEVINRQEYYF